MLTFSTFAQTNYEGKIGKSSVEFLIEGNEAIYKYNKYDNPIHLKGQLENRSLKLYEKDEKNDTSACLIFDQFNPDNDLLIGEWRNSINNKKYKIRLSKTKNDSVYLQRVSFENFYFKVGLSKIHPGGISNILIYEKGTDQLVQNYDSQGIESCSGYYKTFDQIQGSADYNSDGFTDFSLFGFQAGWVVVRSYILYEPNKKEFIDTGIEGSDMEFDGEIFTEYSRDATSSSLTKYKVVNNQLISVSSENTELFNNEGELFWDISSEDYYYKNGTLKSRIEFIYTDEDNVIKRHYNFDENGNQIVFFSNNDTTFFDIYVPHNFEQYENAIDKYENKGQLEIFTEEYPFIQKKIHVPFTIDTLTVIQACCEAAAKAISPFENDIYVKVTYFKIKNNTAYILLDVHQNGWSGAWDFKRKIEPIIEKSIMQFQQIENVKFDYVSGDGNNEH